VKTLEGGGEEKEEILKRTSKGYQAWEGGEGYSLIWAIQVCSFLKGMVF